MINQEFVKAVFFEASDLPAAERAAFLDEVCIDAPDVRAEVESLLAHDFAEDLIALTTLSSLHHGSSLGPTRKSSSAPRQDYGPRYRELSALGEGAFGRVIRCFDSSLRREVALKEALYEDEELDDLLLQEARLLAYLDHPGVVQVYDVQDGAGSVAYTMKVIGGETLRDGIEAGRTAGTPTAISESVRIVSRVCETLANAHDKGVLHLDLKPANIMIEAYGRVSVIDWGVARFFDAGRYQDFLVERGEGRDERLEDGRATAGTPAYMPPEQFGSDAALTPAADVYALGTILFELLTGERPYPRRPNTLLLAHDKAFAPAPLLRTRRPDVPLRLEALCARMLDKEAGERPASCDEVLAELAAMSTFGDGLKERLLPRGAVLFNQGDAGTTAFQVLRGTLDIAVLDDEGAPRVVAQRGTGDIIGELAMLSNKPRTATVTAATEVRVRPLDWPALERELAKLNPLIGQMMRSLSDKLVETTRR